MILSQEQMKQLEKAQATTYKLFKCEVCRDEFYTSKANTKYCGSSCSSIAYRARLKESNSMRSLNIENDKVVIADPEIKIDSLKDNTLNTVVSENIESIEVVEKEKPELKPNRSLMDRLYCRKK